MIAKPTKERVKVMLRAIGDVLYYSQRVTLKPHVMSLYYCLERFLAQTKVRQQRFLLLLLPLLLLPLSVLMRKWQPSKAFRSFRNATIPIVSRLLPLLGCDFLQVADDFYTSYVGRQLGFARLVQCCCAL